jgi:hypothetical protein
LGCGLTDFSRQCRGNIRITGSINLLACSSPHKCRGRRRSRGIVGGAVAGNAQPYRTAGAVGAGKWVRGLVGGIFSHLRSLADRRAAQPREPVAEWVGDRGHEPTRLAWVRRPWRHRRQQSFELRRLLRANKSPRRFNHANIADNRPRFCEDCQFPTEPLCPRLTR